MQQAELGMTGSEGIDEHGTSDSWDRGGVYDADGNYNLEATKSLLEERFKPISEQLPGTVGDFTRTDAPTQYSARYESTVPYDNENGVRVKQCTVNIFPQGPYLNRWTVEIDEGCPGRTSSWWHSDAQKLDSVGAAVATAVAIMRGEVPRSRTE